MDHSRLNAFILPPAEKYLKKLSPTEQAIVVEDIEELRSGNFERVHTKQLRGQVRELVVGNHRFSYFQFGISIYVVRGFRKKTNKTPPPEIEYAFKIYSIVKNNNGKNKK